MESALTINFHQLMKKEPSFCSSSSSATVNSILDTLNHSPCLIALCLIAGVWFFSSIPLQYVFSGDETRVAGISAEMLFEGNYLIPKLNGSPFLEYPPFYYWCMAFSMKIFGCNDAAASIPTLLSAFGCVLVTFVLARKLGASRFEAFLSGFIMMSSAQFISNAQDCRTDMMLTFFVTSSICGYVCLLSAETFRKRLLFCLITALSMGLSVLTKGLVGLVLSGSALGGFVVADDLLHRKFRLSRYLWLGCAGLAALLPLIAWGTALYCACGEEAIHTLLVQNGIHRFSNKTADHAGPFYGYLLILPELFEPWLIFVLIGLWTALQKVRRQKDSTSLFFLAYILFPFFLLCCSSGKRVVYLLPLTAGCAVLSAKTVCLFLEKYILGEAKQKWLCVVQKVVKLVWGLCPVLLLLSMVVFLVLGGSELYYLAVLFVLTGCLLFVKSPSPVLRNITVRLCLIGLTVNAVFGIFTVRDYPDNYLGPFCEEVREFAEKEGRPLLIDADLERMRGAIWFHTHSGLSECKLKDYTGAPELWILRTREKGVFSGSDKHNVFRMPEDIDIVQKILKK